MNKEQIQSELFVSSNKSKIKSKLISFSLAMNNSNTKQNSFKNSSNFKFKTQKTSPEKTILKQDLKNITNEPLKNRIDKNKISEIDNSEKDILNANEEYMKQKILKKKLDSSNLKRANFINFSNLFHNLSANNRQSTLNNQNVINQTKRNKINIFPTNINYQKAILINNSINSPKIEDSKQKITSFSSISYLNHYIGNNNNSRPLTLTGSVIVQHNNKKNDILDSKRIKKNDNDNNNNKKDKNKLNINKNEFLQGNNKKTNLTQPITNKNSRRTSNDKKAINDPLIQGKKNTILTNLTHNKYINSNLTSKTYLRNNKIDDFLISQSVNNLKSNRNDKFQIKKNLLSSSSNNVNIKTQSENSPNSKRKSFTQGNKTIKTKKKNNSINNNNHNNFRNENLLFSKYLVKTSSSGIQKGNFSTSSKDNLNVDNINKKNFNNKGIHSKNKTISHKTSINQLKSNNDFENKNSNNLPQSSKITSKKTLMINQNIFNSNNFPNKKTKSIFKDEEKKRKKMKNIFHSNPENIDKNLLKDFSLNIEKEENEINEKEKNELLQNGKYYKKLSDNLSKYIKNYYNKHNDYPKTKISFYKFGRLIGRGAFGKVNLGLHILTGKIVAIKSFNKSNLKDENSIQKIYHEINLMKSLKHNSIVRILETLEIENYILIIMENISGGNLLNFVKKRTKLNEKTSKFIFKQLINSLKYIHSKNIVHRDIKLDNILIDLNNNIKICDFGVGKQYINGEKLKDKCGTPAYIAPEILKNFGYEGPPVDIWSSGVVLYALLSGTVPFKANNSKDLQKLILKGVYKKISGISFEAQDLIDKLLEVDPRKRISIDGIFKHPWMCFNEKNCDENNLNYNDDKIKLFTKAEIVLLSKENVDYRICDKNEMLENFTLKNLYTVNDEINKDIRTKSLILAPFNSTIENNEDREKYLLENKNSLYVRNDVFLFSENTKVLNRQYELNNNGEIDHGILIKFNDSKNKEKSNEKFNNNSNIVNDVLNDNNKSEEFEKDNLKISKKDSKRNISSLTDSSTIDENILKTMENFGYKREDVQRYLLNNEFNYVTATYFLLSNPNSPS